jgi:predicted HTH transcriptional regulator
MHPLIYIAIGFIVGIIVSHLTKSKSTKIGNISQERTSAKEENKDKIVTYLKEHPRARNNDIEELLGVSDATSTRYLDELEKEGLVQQIGSAGAGVEYKLKNGSHE